MNQLQVYLGTLIPILLEVQHRMFHTRCALSDLRRLQRASTEIALLRARQTASKGKKIESNAERSVMREAEKNSRSSLQKKMKKRERKAWRNGRGENDEERITETKPRGGKRVREVSRANETGRTTESRRAKRGRRGRGEKGIERYEEREEERRRFLLF